MSSILQACSSALSILQPTAIQQAILQFVHKGHTPFKPILQIQQSHCTCDYVFTMFKIMEKKGKQKCRVISIPMILIPRQREKVEQNGVRAFLKMEASPQCTEFQMLPS